MNPAPPVTSTLILSLLLILRLAGRYHGEHATPSVLEPDGTNIRIPEAPLAIPQTISDRPTCMPDVNTSVNLALQNENRSLTTVRQMDLYFVELQFHARSSVTSLAAA